MRDIKFRAWDKINYMSNPFTLHDLQSKKIEFTNDCPVMQYTGLKDKNGKEIYEGDIVKDGDFTMQVSYNNFFASFCLRKSGWMHDHYFNEASKPENCEIIGNIYENPELINEKQL